MWNRALENWTFGQPLKMPRTLYRRIWFLCETELSQQSRAPCADIIFQTSSAHASLAIFVWNQALAPVSCTFCHLHVPKVLQTFFPDDISLVHTLHTSSITFFRSCELFSNFCHTSSWHYSLVHPVPAFPSVTTSTTLSYFTWNRALLPWQSRTPLPTWFPKKQGTL